MIYKSVVLSVASKDIRSAAKWYNERSKGLGQRFVLVVKEEVRFICHNPYAFEVRYDNVRTIPLKKFPYMLHYYVNEAEKEIVVIAVLHTSRNPDIWSER